MDELLKETLTSIKEYLPNLLDATGQISEYLQTENDWEALNLLIQVSEGMDWSIQAINHLQNFKNLSIIDTEELSNILIEINNALQIRDFVLIADLFEYEVHPILKNWSLKVCEYDL